MSNYEPFTRGPSPVGTRQYNWTDTSRDLTLPVDVWYPATETHRGQDFEPATMDTFEMVPGMGHSTQNAVMNAQVAPGDYPLVVFSHGYGGERRQSTFFYTHLASHGYVVAAMDHVGNTTVDLLSGEEALSDPALNARLIRSRPLDATFVIDQMVSGASGLSILSEQIGMSGHSFGGWTTLKTMETDMRIRAALPLAPAGGVSDGGGVTDNAIANALSFEWGRDVPTLYLVGELDSLLPLDGMQDLYNRTPDPRTMVVLPDADHFHFNDNVELSHEGFRMMMKSVPDLPPEMAAVLDNMKPAAELVPGSNAYDLINGLGLAHFDAALKGHVDAKALMSSDLVSLLAGRNIAIKLLS